MRLNFQKFLWRSTFQEHDYCQFTRTKQCLFFFFWLCSWYWHARESRGLLKKNHLLYKNVLATLLTVSFLNTLNKLWKFLHCKGKTAREDCKLRRAPTGSVEGAGSILESEHLMLHFLRVIFQLKMLVSIGSELYWWAAFLKTQIYLNFYSFSSQKSIPSHSTLTTK